MKDQDPVASGAGRARIPIVGIGASAGGIHALQRLFSALPDKPGAAFVVIIHLDPNHESELGSILQLRTSMPVVQVNSRLSLEANHVYVIPPNRRLLVTGSDIATAPFEEQRGHRSPVDLFFRSLAEEHGDGCAVVLSGSGSDGSLGVRSVKEHGGIVLVQDPAEAEFSMMPKSAVAAGADFVFAVEGIAAKLVELLQAKANTPILAESVDASEVMQRILAYLRTKTGQDFSHYKRPTLTRRIARRVQVVQADSLNSYLSYLRDHPEEVSALFTDLLISVTSFFRDANAYRALTELVIAPLLERDQTRPIRVWVPGCATGEEAYSIAILILEEAARRERHPAVQIFASDLDGGALATARAGRYPRAIEAEVSPERLARFFTLEGEHYCVRQELRDQVVFAVHGLLKDPPFSRLDLISCRNLMIYLERDLQEQACRTFNYALAPGGYLFLGSSETADHPAGLFTSVDREARIYQATAQTRSHLPPLPTLYRTAADEPAELPARVAPSNDLTSHRVALEQLAPPSMLVGANLCILHLSETAGRFLQLPGGRPTTEAGASVRPELRLDVEAGLHRAFEHDERSVSLPIPVRFNGTPQAVVVQITPIKEDGRVRKALVLFVEGGPADETGDAQEANGSSPIVVKLREELLANKSLLRITREQYETAMEELKAANEELQSINEEYRSTAEELETSKEELQSINEELQTLNNELKLKFDMVSRAHNDLQNLMGATDIATLFLDKSMRIKRFTPKTADLFNIHIGDEGRPISDFTHRLEYQELVSDAGLVLADLTPLERTIHTLDDRWLTTRLRPYRTIDDKIEGVVVTFFDITERRRLDAEWAARQQLLLKECGHRIKNLLSVVMAVVSQTFANSTTDKANRDVRDRILQRLHAVATAHDALVKADWKQIELHELVRNQLAAYMDNQQIAIDGPPVQIDAADAESLALVLHELATNALKYGSLSADPGKVSLSWMISGDTADRRLNIVWRESGGPPVTAPKSRGLGLALIESGIAGSAAESSFDASGVTWRFDVPLRNHQKS